MMVDFEAFAEELFWVALDVLCQAKSGMGKAAVFVLSTLQQIEPVAGQVAALVQCTGLTARGDEADSNLDGGDAGEGGVGVAGSGQEKGKECWGLARIVLFLCCILLLPFYIFASPILKLLGQPTDVAELCGDVAVWLIALHFSFALQFPVQRLLQSQLRTMIIAWVTLAAFLFHVLISWLIVAQLKLGVIDTTFTLGLSWWILVFGMVVYVYCGGSPLTWNGFSMEAFSGLSEFIKLSTASGVMVCLENWYYRILILMTGNLKNAEIALDALAICMTINGWEMMIPFAFFAGVGVRVANELGAGNGKGAKFAATVAVMTSIVIGLFFWLLIVLLHDKFAFIFSHSKPVIDAVSQLSVLLAFTILFNSVQPVLSGVAVGSGWQGSVAYINLGCYYLIGVPLGFLMGWKFHLGVTGIWAGMIFGGTAIQTLILVFMTIHCDWDNEAEKASKRMKKWGDSSS